MPENGMGRVTLIDRTQQRICKIDIPGRSRTEWIKEDNETGAYQIHIWNQYGLDVSKRLSLSTWEITITTRGDCSMSPMDCTQQNPPDVSITACDTW